MGASVPSNPALGVLFNALMLAQNANYSLAAAVTFLLYDVCMTLSDEVKFIWRNKWSIPKFLYLMGRYYGLLHLLIRLGIETRSNLSAQFCKVYYWYYIMGGDILFTTMINILFAIRVHALYGRSRKVLILFLILCLGEFGFDFYSSYVVGTQVSKNAFAFPAGLGVSWPGCLTAPQRRKFTLISWIPCICVAWVFFLASLLRLRHSFKNAIALQGTIVGTARPTLVTIMIRDGTIYFCLILAILLVCTTTSSIGHGQLYPLASPWLIAVYSFSATQVILNLRRAAEQEDTLSGILLKETGRGPKFAQSTVESGLGIVVNRTGAFPDRFEA